MIWTKTVLLLLTFLLRQLHIPLSIMSCQQFGEFLNIVQLLVYTYTYISISIYLYIYLYISIYISIDTYIYIYIYIYIYKDIYMYKYIDIYIYYIYLYTYIYIYIYLQSSHRTQLQNTWITGCLLLTMVNKIY